jgi:hypothetical protein
MPRRTHRRARRTVRQGRCANCNFSGSGKIAQGSRSFQSSLVGQLAWASLVGRPNLVGQSSRCSPAGQPVQSSRSVWCGRSVQFSLAGQSSLVKSGRSVLSCRSVGQSRFQGSKCPRVQVSKGPRVCLVFLARTRRADKKIRKDILRKGRFANCTFGSDRKKTQSQMTQGSKGPRLQNQ